jgi:hypothetical protein
MALCLLHISSTRLVVVKLCCPAMPSSTTSYNRATIIFSMITSPPTHSFVTVPLAVANATKAAAAAAVDTTLHYIIIISQITQIMEYNNNNNNNNNIMWCTN